MSMNISQVKKLRKIVRMKKLATNNNKIFVCTMKKTSVNYRMALTLLPCFYPCAISKFITAIYAYLCFQYFSKQFINDYISTQLYGQEARRVFIQHPRYNIEVFLKRTMDGRSIVHRRWPKVARTFNITEGSIFAYRFNSFSDDIHLPIYHL
jgi:hypothetical protein